MPDVEIGGRFGRLYGFLDWPLRLVGLNLLWILGVLAGLVVGGLAPSTLALYAVVREYVRGGSPRMWHDFWGHWRAGLASSQVPLGLPILTVWVVAFYLLLSRQTPFAIVMAVLAAGYLATLLQLPAVMAHLDLRVPAVWQVALEVAWRRPLATLGMTVLVVALVVLAWFASPAALPLFFPALPALLATLQLRRALPNGWSRPGA